MQSLYDILQIPVYATDEEITNSYRRLALEYHPDRGGRKEQFQELQSAYSTLSDCDERRTYDIALLNQEAETPGLEVVAINHDVFVCVKRQHLEILKRDTRRRFEAGVLWGLVVLMASLLSYVTMPTGPRLGMLLWLVMFGAYRSGRHVHEIGKLEAERRRVQSYVKAEGI
jgi:hypothetical protein